MSRNAGFDFSFLNYYLSCELRSRPIAMADEQVTSSLNIMRRMPPKDIEDNLSGLLNLVPDHTDELLQRVDQPLQVATCPETQRAYLLCDYNRDGDSYRCVCCGAYHPRSCSR